MTIPNDFFSSIALPLAELGYLVFPLQSGSKIPMPGSSGCNDGTTDPVTIKAWAAQYPNANVGIHCTGLVVIDLDEKDGKHGLADLDEVILDLGSLPNGPSVETPTDGRHLYFKAPAVTVKNAQGVKWKDRKTGIDIRTDGGYVVAPGSVIDGKKYVAASSLPHASELPELSSAWIDGFLTAKPPSVVVSEFVLPPGEFKGDVEKRAAAYVAAMPPAVQGQGGHDALLKVANAIFWGFGLDMTTGWPIMLEYNQRCNPPWNLADPKDEKDFRRKMDQAREKPPTNPAGWLLENLSGSGEITLTPDISSIINQARTAMSQTPLPPRKPPFGVRSHEQLLKMDLTPHFLIENVLVEGQPMIVGAPRKCLKTSILLDMALSLATGKSFLGYFKVLKTCKVLMMSGESGLATILETINRIMQQKNKDRSLGLLNADGKEVSVPWERLISKGVLPIADNVLISDAVPTLSDMEHMGTLNDILDEAKPDVVIFDPAYLMMDGEAVENVMKMGAQLRGITEVCIRHKATMILAHHFTKGSQKTEKGKPLPMPDLNDLSWSGFAEFARQWILLNRPTAYRSGSGEHKLNMVIGGSVGHGCECNLEVKEGRRRDGDGNTLERVWQPTVREWTEEAQAERDKQVEDGRKNKIRQCLIETPDGLIIRDISKATGVSGKILNELLADMVNAKEIQEVPAIGKNKQKTVKYVLLAAQGVADFCESFRSNNETPTEEKPAKKRAAKKSSRTKKTSRKKSNE